MKAGVGDGGRSGRDNSAMLVREPRTRRKVEYFPNLNCLWIIPKLQLGFISHSSGLQINKLAVIDHRLNCCV